MRSVKSSPPGGRLAGQAAPAGQVPSFPFRSREVKFEASSGALPARLFDGPNCVYLSPHHDDVCFSLAGLIRHRPGGRLINLFTRSAYSLNPPTGEHPDVEAITARRTEEDNAFAAACHLNKVDLGLTDAPLFGRSAMDLSAVHDDCASLRAPLLARLRAIAAETPASERLTLFCPAGIGGHVNHVATMLTVIAALPVLRQHYDVMFYEDLHYAAKADARQLGLLRLFAALNGRNGTRIAIGFNSDAPEKLALVRLYRSQFKALPDTCANYSPNVEDAALGMHEAVWDFALAVSQNAGVVPRATPAGASPGSPTPTASDPSRADTANGTPSAAGLASAGRDNLSPSLGGAQGTGREQIPAADAAAAFYRPPSNVEALLTQSGAPDRTIRINLNAVNRATTAASMPLVSCLMVTSDRPMHARIAVECYRRQTWRRRQLVIVDTGADRSLEAWLRDLNDPSINFKRMPRGNLTLGDIRNVSASRARGEFMCIWDDDDLHHPLRIVTQMTALSSADAAACLLGKVTIWWPSRAELSTSRIRPWEGTLLCKRAAMPRYVTKDKAEDTPAVAGLLGRERVVQIDAPELYVYVRHSSNTWDENHFERHMMRSAGRFTTAKYDEMLARLQTAYPVHEYLNAIGDAHGSPSSNRTGESRLPAGNLQNAAT